MLRYVTRKRARQAGRQAGRHQHTGHPPTRLSSLAASVESSWALPSKRRKIPGGHAVDAAHIHQLIAIRHRQVFTYVLHHCFA